MKWKRNWRRRDVHHHLQTGLQSAGGYTGVKSVKVDLSENQAVVELIGIDDEVLLPL